MKPLLRVSAHRMLHRDEHRHVDDLAQEMWVAVWRGLPQLPVLCTELSDQIDWCMAVARNGGRNWIRSTLTAPTHGEHNSYLPAEVDLLDILLEVPKAVDQVERAYHDGRVAEAVANLPEGYRGYVVERFWHGTSTTELQKRMSPSIWTRVKKRLAVELKELV